MVLAVLGFADATWGTMRNAIAQLAAGDAYRGRVMSLIVMVARGLTSASQVETGVATALLGAPGAATIGALAIGGTLAAAAARGKPCETSPRRPATAGPRRSRPAAGGES